MPCVETSLSWSRRASTLSSEPRLPTQTTWLHTEGPKVGFFYIVQPSTSFLSSHLLYGYHGNKIPPPPSQGTRRPPQENSSGRLVSSCRGTSILQSDIRDGSSLFYLPPPPSKDSGGSGGGDGRVKRGQERRAQWVMVLCSRGGGGSPGGFQSRGAATLTLRQGFSLTRTRIRTTV